MITRLLLAGFAFSTCLVSRAYHQPACKAFFEPQCNEALFKKTEDRGFPFHDLHNIVIWGVDWRNTSKAVSRVAGEFVSARKPTFVLFKKSGSNIDRSGNFRRRRLEAQQLQNHSLDHSNSLCLIYSPNLKV